MGFVDIMAFQTKVLGDKGRKFEADGGMYGKGRHEKRGYGDFSGNVPLSL